MVAQTPAKEAVACLLCGLPASYPIRDEAGQAYCCPACREVAALLADEASARPEPVPAAAAESSSATLSVGGLWCASCAWLIAERLKRSRGVTQAEVSFLQREAQISYDPARTNARQLVKRVRRLGYRAWLPGETPYDEEEAHETRLLISGVLVMHVMVISFMLYLRHWLGWSSPETRWLEDFFQLMLMVASLPVVLILGIPILRAGLAGLAQGLPNTHTLIALGSFSAYVLSVRNLLAGQQVYFDTAAVLLFLVAIGHWLEIQAQKASSQAVDRLWQQMPAEATLVTAAGEEQVPASAVVPGSRVRVRPGARFPVDGLVATGQGDVDESLLTGEPEPVTRAPGDRVLAGTLNLDGAFDLIATATGPETVTGQIGRLLHQALWQRAPVQRLADRLAGWMVPLALFLAGGTFTFWSWRAGAETGLVYALSVLLIACPCALGIATPLTLWLGVERAAAAGIILRHTGVLEKLATARALTFDKTGTLTRRPIRLQAVEALEGALDPFLGRVMAVEALSEHPLAQAIVAGARRRLDPGSATASTAAPLPRASDFQALPGRGARATLAGSQGPETVWVGSRALMEEAGLALPPALAQRALAWQAQGMHLVYAGWQGQVTGLLGLGEVMRQEVPATIAAAQALGLQVTVLTGDDEAAGRRWQELLGVPVLAGLQPADKVARLEAAGQAVMVGDGINDGPALAAAHVGLAVADTASGQGTDVAQAAADGLLLGRDLRSVPWLVTLARLAMRKVRQNLAWAFVYNLAGLALAVSGRLQPELAALAMVLSNLIVTRNALRLRRLAPGPWQGESDIMPASSKPGSDSRMAAHEVIVSL